MTLYGTFPVLVPGSTESQSVYGLKKTHGTILFKPGQEGKALALAEESGSVFPDPQIRTTDMGLLEMSFDAYTDTGAASGVFGTEVLNLSKSFSVSIEQESLPTRDFNWTITETWFADSFTERKVLSASLVSVNLMVSQNSLSKRMLKRVITGNKPSEISTVSSLSITWTSQVSSVTRRNFGIFDEVDIVSSLSATIA
jgi:hypothetical protein